MNRPFNLEHYAHRKVRYVLNLDWREGHNLKLIETVRDAYLSNPEVTWSEAVAFDQAVTSSPLTIREWIAEHTS